MSAAFLVESHDFRRNSGGLSHTLEFREAIRRYMAVGITVSAVLGVALLLTGQELAVQIARLIPPHAPPRYRFVVIPISPLPSPPGPPMDRAGGGSRSVSGTPVAVRESDPRVDPDDLPRWDSPAIQDPAIQIGPGDPGSRGVPREPITQPLRPESPGYPSRPPVPLNEVRPEYPEIARASGVEGRVSLLLLVGLDGRVEDVEVESGASVLNEAAIRAARTMLFRAAEANGNRVRVWVREVFSFRLRD